MGKIMLVLMASLFVSACNCTNPTKGGFAGGVCGLASGNYEERLNEREQELAAIKARQQSIADERSALQKERDETQRRLRAVQTQVSDLANEIDKLNAALRNKHSATQAVKRQHSQLAEQIAQMNREISQTRTDSPEKAQVEQQRKRAEQLEAEVRNLWDIVNTLN